MLRTLILIYLSWFVRLASAQERLNVGYEYCGANKTIHTSFEWDLNKTEFMDIIGEISPGVFLMQANYTMDDKPYDIQLFKNDCRTIASPNFPIIFDVDKNTNTHLGDGKNFADLFFIYNQSIIQSSDIWTSNKTGGYVEFCLQATNYLASSTDPNATDYDPFQTSINILNILYRIEVNSLSTFEISIDVIPDEPLKAVRYIDYSEEIEAYQCDDSFDKLLPPPALTQGDFLNICVETIYLSRFAVHSISDVSVSQSGRIASPSSISYPYVTNYVDSTLAESSCIDTNTTEAVCKTKMQILGFYFDDPFPTPLYVSGNVRLDYIGEQGRRLVEVPLMMKVAKSDHNGGSGRLLDQEVPGGGYNVSVTMAPKNTVNGAKSSSTLLAVGHVYSLSMCFVSVASLFIFS